MARFRVLILVAALVTACSAPPPPAAQPPEVTPPQVDQPASQPEPVAAVPPLLAEIKALMRQQGMGGEIQHRLEMARSLAGSDANLLAQVAGVALAWDPQLALAIAEEAITADAGSMPARVALGAALAASARYAEARGHLEQAYAGTDHGLDAGYHLALTLEALGETNAARTLLTDLTSRFPASVEARQALARVSSRAGQWPAPGTPGTSVAGWKPELWWATSQLLIGVHADEETVEAIGLDGRGRWTLSCGGKATDLVVDESGALAMLSASGQGCLIDLASGAVLLKQPGLDYYLSTGGLAWRGGFIAFGEDVQPTGFPGPSGYFGTNWHVYRLNRDPAGRVTPELQYEALEGSRRAALSADGRTLFTWLGNHGAGRPRLFQDGRMVTDYPDIPVGDQFALDPRGDRFYFVNYFGVLQARSLDGQVLWEASSDQWSFPLLAWTDSAGQVRLAVNDKGGTAVYSDTGERAWTTPGTLLMPLGVGSLPFLMTREGRDVVLIDESGKPVARYPSDAWLTRDGRAMVRPVSGRIDLYRIAPDLSSAGE